MKRLTLLFLTIFGAAALLFAGGAAEETAEGVQIDFWTIQLSPTFDDYINGVIDDFQSDNPEVTVNWTDVPFDQIETRVQTAAASGNMPDVVNLNPHFASQLLQYDVLLDMNEAAADVRDDYYDGIWRASELGGKAFGLPWYVTSSMLFYNKDAFDEAGLDPENPPTNYEALLEAAGTIQAETGLYGYMTFFSQQFVMEELEKMGNDLFTDGYGEANFTSDGILEAVGYYQQLLDDNVMPQSALNEGTGTAIQLFSAGELATFQGGTSHARMIEENSQAVYSNTGVGPQPLGPGGEPNVAVMNITVANESEYQDAAVAFAKFITNAENQLEFAREAGSIVPSTTGATEADFFTAGPDASAAAQARAISAEMVAQGTVIFPPVENWGEIRDTFVQAFTQAVAGEGEPQQLLQDAEDEVNDMLGGS